MNGFIDIVVKAGLSRERAEAWRTCLSSCAELDAAEAWGRLAREQLLPEDPFPAHQAAHAWVYRDWPSDRGPAPVWVPTPERAERSNAVRLANELGLRDLETLHRWSGDHRAEYWRRVLDHLQLAMRTPPSAMLARDDPQSPGWLPDAQWNIAASCFLADPSRTAIVHQDEGGSLQRVSYRELSERTLRIAGGLRALGVSVGDAVGLMAPLTPQSIAAYLACLHVGAVAVAIAESFAAGQIAERLLIAKARLLIVQDVLIRDGRRLRCYEKCRELPDVDRVLVLHRGARPDAELSENAIALADLPSGEPGEAVPFDSSATATLLFSSGTTGAPKAIPWTHLTPVKCAADAWLHHDVGAESVLCWPTSLGWMMGPWLIFAGLLNRASIATFDGSPKGTPFTTFVGEAGVTMLGVVPSLVRAWRAAEAVGPTDFSGVRVFSSTGECSQPDDMMYLMSRAGYQPVIEYCGGTEIGGGYITSFVGLPAAPATFQSPAMGLDFEILSEDKHNEEGEAFLLPPSIGLSERLWNADHDAVYFAGAPRSPRGVLRRHGDRLRRLPGGGFEVVGRADDAMNLGGVKVSSAELERCLAREPGVREVAAVAATPQRGPSQLVVFCVLDVSLDADALRDRLQQRLSRELNPLFRIRRVAPMESLPRTASNKVIRRALRDQAAELLKSDS